MILRRMLIEFGAKLAEYDKKFWSYERKYGKSSKLELKRPKSTLKHPILESSVALPRYKEDSLPLISKSANN